jgi:hypothetical protein
MTEDNVKAMPVAQLVMLVKDNTPMGVEVVWEPSVTHVADACTTLNIARAALGDAAWIVRQVERVSTDKKLSDTREEATVQ